MPPTYDAQAAEAKWLRRWQKAGVYEHRRGTKGQPKFFLHFAYPGISGYLHVGHLRGFSYSDMFVRYKRMTGHHVYFPAGFHASGIPSVGLARRVERGDPETIKYLKNNGCPADVIPKLADPLEVVRYFSQVYHDDYWRRFGYLISPESLCTTIDPGYQRFIQWQFRKLKQQDLLVVKPHYGPHCPVDGAVAVDASETDISSGGDAQVNEYVMHKFRLDDGTVLPCATLRPETIWGVTNLWINPDADYVRVRVGQETWILSRDAANKLAGLRDDVGQPAAEDAQELAASLFSQEAKNPFTGAKIPILRAPFVQPDRATGVVMSVPAHAPFDWIALREIRPDLDPIVIIRHPKLEGVPAEAACKKFGVKSQADKQALDLATDEVYADEFHGGEMLPNCGPMSGHPVRQAKEETVAMLKAHGSYELFQDFNKNVVCRCGQPVYLRRIPDQWFIRYSDKELTRKAQAHASQMTVLPAEYQRDMPAVLDWFQDRACIRRGSWLGTEFPFKEEWIIEPISDSTFYPAYYIVSPYINRGALDPKDLSDAFFDYVFHGVGEPQSPVWGEVRKDFEYWYPVDINLGGKEHKTVHFPVYVMNHVALVEQAKWPRGIFVNWWVTQRAGEKISKSKGGAEPIPGAAKRYGVDALRLYYANVASAHVDLEWDADKVGDYTQRVQRLHRWVTDFCSADKVDAQDVDTWLAATWNQRLAAARQALDEYDLRTATNQLYFEFYNDLLWWQRRGGRPNEVTLPVVNEWVRALAPVTPFLAEELNEVVGSSSLVTTSAFPDTNDASTGDEAMAQETYLRSALDDLRNVARLANVDRPRRVIVYTSPAWKRDAHQRVVDAVRGGERNPGKIIQSLMADPSLKQHAKLVAGFVQRSFKDALKGSDARVGVDEYQALSNARGFLAHELGCDVEVYAGDDDDAPDPANKRAVASPGKPGLYVEA